MFYDFVLRTLKKKSRLHFISFKEMKNTPSQIKNRYSESPKTPGGISKSLLTPCRRVGLSRNWRSKGTISPFISPLGGSGSTNEPQNEPRKRKKDGIEERDNCCDSNTTERQIKEDDQNENLILSCNTPTSTLNRTPSRSLIRRKKSKTLLLTQDNEVQNDNEQIEMNSFNCKYDSEQNNSATSTELLEKKPVQTVSKVSNLLSLKTKNKTLSNSETAKSISDIQKTKLKDKTLQINNIRSNSKEIEVSNNNVNKKNEEKSPNNLTKECIVVIQNKIFKSISPIANTEKACTERNPVQISCESDNDDIPLCYVGSKENLKHENKLKNNDNLVESEYYVKKLDKTTSVTDLKIKIIKKKTDKKPKYLSSQTPSQSSNSFDDDDDFQTDKRTILIKKSYSKLVKPTKAKSTGSITQKDIDELRAHIERKKNLLMAKAMSIETDELRGLIKKWQQGCQTALTELLELMKREMPGQTMDYSEILKMLKIPPDLVGYDSENDCFNTPDDKNILLSGFNLNKI